MKERQAAPQAANSDKNWLTTSYANLVRYVPSKMYFARFRVRGKLIRKSLKTDRISIAKLRLADLEKSEREAAEVRESASKGRMTFGDALAIFKAQTEASHLLKPSAKHYRMEVITAILKSWPEIEGRDHSHDYRGRVQDVGSRVQWQIFGDEIQRGNRSAAG